MTESGPRSGEAPGPAGAREPVAPRVADGPVAGVEHGEGLPPEALDALHAARQAFTERQRPVQVSPKVLVVLVAAVALLVALAFAPRLLTGSQMSEVPAGPVSEQVALEAVRGLDPAFAGLPLRAPQNEQGDWIDVLPSGSVPGAFSVEVRLDGGSFFYTVTEQGMVRAR